VHVFYDVLTLDVAHLMHHKAVSGCPSLLVRPVSGNALPRTRRCEGPGSECQVPSVLWTCVSGGGVQQAKDGLDGKDDDIS